jgi:hypothetical protein
MSRLDHPDTVKIQEYRAKAMEALEHAATCKVISMRGSWDTIAIAYYDMAERLERKALGK